MRVIYKLKVAEQTAQKGKKSGFRDKNFPSAESLPAISRVLVKNEDGTTTPRKIRYCPNESSIFMDEQDKTSRPEKIRFESGIKVVNTETEPLIYQFMEMIDHNGSNPSRNKNKKVIFMRDDPIQKAKDKLESAESLQKKLAGFWTMKESDREAVAQMWGIKTIGQDPSIWQTKLLMEAQKRPQQFVDLVESGDFEIIDITTRAQKVGILEYFKQVWMFNNVDLCRVPRGVNKTIQLMEHLRVHKDTLGALATQTDKLENKLKAKSTAEVTCEAYSAADALDLGLERIGEKQVLTYDKGKGWRFVEPYDYKGNDMYTFGDLEDKNRNSKNKAIEFIRSNDEVKLEIFIRREELLKEKAANRTEE